MGKFRILHFAFCALYFFAFDINSLYTVEEQLINAAGSIEVDNFDFITQKTSITISGAGDLNVYCEVELIISVSGAASIRYKGSPQISRNASGALTMEHID